MKFSALLDRFKKPGLFHVLLAIVTHFAMIESFYIIIALSAERMPPVIACSSSSDSNTFGHHCTIVDYCRDPVNNSIDSSHSINNWSLRHHLYCNNEVYFKYLISTIFFCSIVSALTMSIIADKAGRLVVFRLEAAGCLFGFTLLYFDYSLAFVFVGVISVSLCNHLYNTSLLYIYEYFPWKLYIYLLTVQNISYGLFGLLINFYSDYYLETRTLFLGLVILSVLTFVYSLTYVTESPDWLISHYKYSYNKDYLDKLRATYHYFVDFNYRPENRQQKIEAFDAHVK